MRVRYAAEISSKSAFTQVELLVVIALLSMVMIGIPSMHAHLKRQGIQLAVDQLCTDLQLARLMAINQKKNCAIQFDRKKNQYANSLTHTTTSLSRYQGDVHLLERGPDGEKMISEIKFQRRGMSSTWEHVYLSDAAGARIFRIGASPAGGIRVSEWIADDWN